MEKKCKLNKGHDWLESYGSMGEKRLSICKKCHFIKEEGKTLEEVVKELEAQNKAR